MELTAFVTIVEERSFRRAAARLNRSPSALSHTIRSLEQRIGVKLLNRTTRSVAPTEAGEALRCRVAPALTEIAGAVKDVGASRANPAGTVRINLPRLAAELVFKPVLARFLETFPDVRLELSIDDELKDIVALGFDAGVRLGERVERDMKATRLTPDLRSTVVGAPTYFARRPPPRHPQDLSHHACINYRWSGSGKLYRWPFEKNGHRLDVAIESSLTLNDTGLILEAAMRGVGLATLPDRAVREHLANGELVSVLDDWCPSLSGFFLYYPGGRHTPLALAALRDFLRARP